MKELFPGYYRKTEAEINNIWENGIIVFDTNTLLNLYRYSDFTRDAILDLISKFSEKIWLPYQVALEYNRNRHEVISEQEKAYKEFLSKISNIQSDLQSINKHPFLSKGVDKDLKKSFEKVSAEVSGSIDKYSSYLKDDPIYNKVAELFRNKIGINYTNEILEKLFKEGEERFKNKIPPGYEDDKTKDSTRKYGDLILWKQIIDQAKDKKKPIILVTDERKKDWWWNLKDGRLIGPRSELIEEINIEAGVDFHMYSSERFLSFGQNFLNEQVNKKAIEELKAIKTSEENESNYISSEKKFSIIRDLKRIERLDRQIDFLNENIEQITNKLNFINSNEDYEIYISDDKESLEKELKDSLFEFEILSSRRRELTGSTKNYDISFQDMLKRKKNIDNER